MVLVMKVYFLKEGDNNFLVKTLVTRLVLVSNTASYTQSRMVWESYQNVLNWTF